jgi:hypothetical protein
LPGIKATSNADAGEAEEPQANKGHKNCRHHEHGRPYGACHDQGPAAPWSERSLFAGSHAKSFTFFFAYESARHNQPKQPPNSQPPCLPDHSISKSKYVSGNGSFSSV